MSLLPSSSLLKAAALGSLLVTGFITVAPQAAQAADCGSGSYSIAQLTAPGFSCSIGDKLYSDFNFTGISTGVYAFSNTPANQHTFSGTSLAFTGPSFTYGYKVSLFNPAPGQAFLNFNTGWSTSDTTGQSDFTKDLTGISGAFSGTSTSYTTNVPPFGNIIVSGNTVPFNASETGPITFTSTITNNDLTAGRMDGITDSITQLSSQGPVDPAPSPLPILGAGAAFAMSRQMRRRIQEAA